MTRLRLTLAIPAALYLAAMTAVFAGVLAMAGAAHESRERSALAGRLAVELVIAEQRQAVHLAADSMRVETVDRMVGP